MESKKLAQLIGELADNKKAENIVILDIRKLSSVADYFVLASGNSEPHLRAIADEIIERLRADHGLKPQAVDGSRPFNWQVLDFFDVIVHIMRTDIRSHYDIESLWGDAPRLKARKKSSVAPRKRVKTGTETAP